MDDFLVTTVLCYGAVHAGKLDVLDRANFYGLTWNESDVFLSWNPRHVNQSVIESREGKRLPFEGVRDVHQILWAQGRLWVTDTARDRVAWWDGARTGSFKVADRGETDTLHINSLWEWDGRVTVLASGLGNTIAGKLLQVTGEPILTVGLHFYHNAYIEDDYLYGCYKDRDLRSGLYRKPLHPGEPDKLFVLPEGSFARGLARGDGFFLVGCSENVPSERRFEGNSWVYMVNDDLEMVEKVELEDTGQIRDVRLLRDDRAHNGLEFPG